MKKRSLLLLGAMVLVCLAGLMAVNADDDEEKTKAKVWLGYRAHNINDSPTRVGEYETLKDSLAAAFKLSRYTAEQGFFAYGRILDADDIDAMFRGDFSRVLRFDGEYTRLYHRMEHDPLTNLQAVAAPKVTRYTDFDPGAEYSTVYTEMKAGAEFNHPDVPWLVLEIGFRHEQRDGMKQVRTMSKCSNCHIVGYSHLVDQTTRDFSLGAKVESDNVSLRYRFKSREFRDRAGTPTHVYDDATHPSLGTPVFYDRVQFWSADGAMPFNMTPDVDKQTHILEATITGETMGTLNAGYVHSNVKNLFTELEMNFDSFRGNYAKKLAKNMGVSLRGVYYNIDSDDVFVDVNEPLAAAGPYAGQTYRQRWDDGTLTGDFTRQSWVDRTVYQFDADLNYAFAPKTRARVSYRYKQTDRDNHEVADGEHASTSNRFKLALSSRKMKDLTLRGHFIYEDISNPFAGVDIAGMQNFNPAPTSSPLAPDSIQYFQLYNSRMVDLTNQPDRVLEFNGALTYRPMPNVSFSAGLKWNDLKNSSLDYSEWDKTRTALNASLWFALSEQAYGTIAYYFKTEETNAAVVLPLFDG